MKPVPAFSTSRQKGLSLIEITLVIGLMLALAAVISYSVGSMTEWKKGRAAAEQLKSVYVAQKGYLADHPTADASSFSESNLIPYLPGRPGSMPTSTSLNEEALVLIFSEMPPVFRLNGVNYDPSDTTDDGLWDVAGL